MLVVGAMALVRCAARHGTRRPWLLWLMQRRSVKVAAVALANQTARTIWAKTPYLGKNVREVFFVAL
jgi:transposase